MSLRTERFLPSTPASSWLNYGREMVIDNRTPPVVDGLVGLYDFESWTGNQWSDISGNNNHATSTTGTISTPTISGNGSSLSIDTLQGATNSGIRFPAAILPSTFTLFHLARYTGGTRRRIFDGVGTNWLSGFWGGNAGVAFHDGWITGQTDTHGNNWVISTDQNSLYRSNGTQRGTGGGATSKQLSINYGASASGESSDWNVAFVAVYNRTLNSTEYGQVESWISEKYGVSI
jgi:hypothetical protein